MIGRGIEFIGHHFVPIPIARNILKISGRIIAGDGRDSFKSVSERSVFGNLGLQEHPNQRIVIGNGIYTTLAEITARAWEVSAATGGYNVHYCYNATHGILPDILETICQSLGISTHASEVCAKGLRKLTQDLANEGGGSISLWAHSQFGQITSNMQLMLKDRELNMINVQTYGSADLIPRGKFGDVMTM